LAHFKTGQGCAESESRSTNRPAQLESMPVQLESVKKRTCACAGRLSTEGSTVTDQSPSCVFVVQFSDDSPVGLSDLCSIKEIAYTECLNNTTMASSSVKKRKCFRGKEKCSAPH